eukprot:352193-Chlamydomonas_euryale.AAC.31
MVRAYTRRRHSCLLKFCTNGGHLEEQVDHPNWLPPVPPGLLSSLHVTLMRPRASRPCCAANADCSQHILGGNLVAVALLAGPCCLPLGVVGAECSGLSMAFKQHGMTCMARSERSLKV